MRGRGFYLIIIKLFKNALLQSQKVSLGYDQKLRGDIWKPPLHGHKWDCHNTPIQETMGGGSNGYGTVLR